MSWDTATAYGNPSNHFWRLLRDADILPKSYRTCDTLLRINNLMPAELGIGTTWLFLFSFCKNERTRPSL